MTYFFKEDRGGPMGSPHRKDALKVMEKKCPNGYIVVQDGEMTAYGSMSSVEGRRRDDRPAMGNPVPLQIGQ